MSSISVSRVLISVDAKDPTSWNWGEAPDWACHPTDLVKRKLFYRKKLESRQVDWIKAVFECVGDDFHSDLKLLTTEQHAVKYGRIKGVYDKFRNDYYACLNQGFFYKVLIFYHKYWTENPVFRYNPETKKDERVPPLFPDSAYLRDPLEGESRAPRRRKTAVDRIKTAGLRIKRMCKHTTAGAKKK